MKRPVIALAGMVGYSALGASGFAVHSHQYGWAVVLFGIFISAELTWHRLVAQ